MYTALVQARAHTLKAPVCVSDDLMTRSLRSSTEHLLGKRSTSDVPSERGYLALTTDQYRI